MLEIRIDNCYKCDLETINDRNNSQYFVRKDLFEKIIKSRKATNL